MTSISLNVTAPKGATVGDAEVGETVFPCALGRAGLQNKKQEGDGATPIGIFPLRRVFYRPDRLSRPTTLLPVRALKPGDGWADDPTGPAYNRLIRKPYELSHEDLWREDQLYNLIIEVGYNDAPPVPGLGSAIFVHVARDGYKPTEGCVALYQSDLLNALARLGPESHLIVKVR